MNGKRVAGYRAAGVASGLKKNGKKDLGLIVSDVPANVAGVFTRNRVQAAPVVLDRFRIKSGICRAVIANSGNANCCTGEKGMEDALAMTRWAGERLSIPEELVLVASTGVIGQPMDIGRIHTAVPDLVSRLRSDGFDEFIEAIMTTDRFPKTASASGILDGKSFTVLGMAKGAGMIRPDMATMLCFVVTDLAASSDMLQGCLNLAVERSFNRITVDGDTSTNDTVLLMANGASGARADLGAGRSYFQDLLDHVLLQLARMMVKDGEGATKLVDIHVTGAASDEDARRVADTVAHSSLVKTALFGADANWGRIIAAAGRAGVEMDPDRVDIDFNDVRMVLNGMGCGDAAEKAATGILKTDEFAITIHLNLGEGKASVMTCDLTLDYVKINADYRS